MGRSARFKEFQTAGWICWFLLACVCLSEAGYKIRRPHMPPVPPPPIMFKRSWPIAHRVAMGNTIHISGSIPPKRISHKPPNYRIRRPPVLNVLPTVWKNQAPIRASLNNHAVLPVRQPVKEFHSINKLPEYSPEYRPDSAVLPATHRGGIDDDKGPIHTIPAPNLSPADKPRSPEVNPAESVPHRQYPHEINWNDPNLQAGTLVTNYGLAAIGTSLAPQRPVTSPTPTQHQYEVTEGNDVGQKAYHTVLPTFFPPELDVTRLSTLVNPELQSNEVYLNHPSSLNTGLIGTNVQLGQANAPMQTNLHSSLHVGFPGTAGQTPYAINQQIPDFHIGHPAPAGPPLSATQLYDLLTSFPQKVTEQYTAGQQPQLQQHMLQQQLGQYFQPAGVTSFSQPQMHSFNYDEQANKELQQQQQQQQHQLQQQQQQQQQQQFLLDQNYALGKVAQDYNIAADAPVDSIQDDNSNPNEDYAYTADGAEQAENNIDYEETNLQRGQSTYFNKVVNDGAVSTQFYTTLPNREAAEKLAALAAAGNVNSQLIGQLRKQQQQQQQESQQGDEPMPANHKDEDPTRRQPNEDYHQDKYQQRKKQQYQHEDEYRQQKHRQYHEEKQQEYEDYDRGQGEYQGQKQYEEQGQGVRYEQRDQDQERYEQKDQEQQRYEQQRIRQKQQNRQKQGFQEQKEEKRPLRILVPDEEERYTTDKEQRKEERGQLDVEYEYENDEGENSQTSTSLDGRKYYQPTGGEFGTRLPKSKNGN
ncbi:hypothetical protein KM043_006931 [Ampulex compressa]|nr:hypothetical protein KM043_006931 [Ampulex compressa]